jgi:hypothetical protein
LAEVVKVPRALIPRTHKTLDANKKGSNLGCRVKQGVLGAANLTVAGVKTAGLVAADSFLVGASPFTGGASLVGAGIVTTYGVTSIGGQTLAGASQLYAAFGGNPQSAEGLSQAGDILSGPISGISTLATGGSITQAQQNANAESIITGGAGLANNKGVLEAVDFGLSLVGLSGTGCPQ